MTQHDHAKAVEQVAPPAGPSTTDLAALERGLMGRVEAASDEAALEAVRVFALGKKGPSRSF